MALSIAAVLPLLAAGITAEATASASGSTPHPWARFKVGTWVKWKSVSVIKMGAGDQVHESETLQTLVSLNAQKAVIEFVQKGEGLDQKTMVDLPLKADPKDLELAAKAPKPSATGTETLTVAGKRFDCSWSEIVTGDENSGRTTMRTWESDAMPGRIVKSVSRSELAPGLSQVMTTEVSAYLLK